MAESINFKLPGLLALALAMTGCAQQPLVHRDPAYAPPVVMPETRSESNQGAIYNPDSRFGLFENVTAYQVGDLLTVLLQEQTSAKKNASTNTSKDSSLSMGVPTLFGASAPYAELEANANANRVFEGQGDANQSNSLQGELAVVVTQVLPNGNMVVKGEKLLTLNQGTEFVRLSGIIRPNDITPENTIVSGKVANASITYSGGGAIHDSNQMGWLQRFFNSPIWPL